ncbi:unnamed protein product, partial [Rangifer tarandus platyrhynchus]
PRRGGTEHPAGLGRCRVLAPRHTASAGAGEPRPAGPLEHGAAQPGEGGPGASPSPAPHPAPAAPAAPTVPALVQFLLSRYLAKEPITEAEVLNSAFKDYQDHFLVVLGQASQYLQLVFGLEVKEVDPSEHTYILVPSLGLTLKEMLRDGHRLPKASLLVVILCLIAVEDVVSLRRRSGQQSARWGCVLGPNPEMVNKEDNNTVLGLSFPRKLWMIMEDVAFTFVHWNDKGDTVVTEANLFQMAVLQFRGADQIYKTDSIKSFIREMNLYGFSKICPSRCSAGKKKLMIYHNFNFQRDKPPLLQNIRRKARWAGGSHLPSEQGGPSGEGMSSNATSVPLATAGREGAGELTDSPPEYPNYNLVMAVYKTFYSTMMAALSVMAPDEASEAEE